MSRPLPSIEPRDHDGAYMVRKPRPADAIGGSLRSMYSADLHVPDDLAALLRRIDGRPN